MARINFEVEQVKNEYIIRIKGKTFLSKFRKKKEYIEEYVGSGTVWRKLPDFKSCDVFTCSYLLDLFEKAKYHDIIK